MSTNGIFCLWLHAVFMQSCLALMSNNNYRLINASTDSSSVRYTNTKSTSDQYPSSMFKSVYNQPTFTQCSSKPQDNMSMVPHRQYPVDNALTFLFLSLEAGFMFRKCTSTVESYVGSAKISFSVSQVFPLCSTLNSLI